MRFLKSAIKYFNILNDREGEYVIVGRTWVKDCIKGDGPFIKKTRIKQSQGEVQCQV